MESSRTLRRAEVREIHDPSSIESLLHVAAEYARSSKASATQRAYDSAWRGFVDWCRARGCDPLPADVATVAAYVADRARVVAPGTIDRAVVAIGQAHRVAELEDPTTHAAVRAVLRGVRRAHGRPAKGKQPLLVGDLVSIVRSLDTSTMAGLRDRALLLLGFGAALRRSELVALEVCDLDFRPNGLALAISRSKTDQLGAGRVVGVSYGAHPETCPVVAARRWLAAAEIHDGPVLRAVDRHDRVRDGRLEAKTVCRIVKRLVPLAGLDPNRYGGHSLRSGFATSAAAVGVEEREIAAVTGHASLVVLRGYIRGGQLFDSALSQRVGL